MEINQVWKIYPEKQNIMKNPKTKRLIVHREERDEVPFRWFRDQR